MTATLAEIRKTYPQYEDVDDVTLANALYKNHYSDMDREEFNELVGWSGEDTVSGFQRGLRDPLDAGAQLLERLLPDRAVGYINDFNDWLVDMGVPLERIGEEGLQGQLENLEHQYQQTRIAEGEDPASFDWERLGGNVASGVASGGAAGLAARGVVPAAATTGGRVASGVGGGAIGGALGEPILDEDNFWQEKGKQTAAGAVTGGLFSGGNELVGGAGRQAARPEVLELQARGVDPTIGQAIGGTVSDLEQKAASIPIVGDMISAQRSRAMTEFNTASINEALEPLGVRVEGAGHDAIEEAQGLVSDAYSAAARATNGMPVDQHARDLIQQLRTVGTAHLDVDAAQNVERFMANVIDAKLANNPGLTRESFEEIDKLLSAKIRSAQAFEVKEVFQGLRDVLLDQAERANPDYAEAYRKARTAAARLMRVEEAASAAKASTKSDAGVFTPGQLIRGASKMETGRKARNVAGGNALMQDLGTLGQEVLGDTVPNSGTADRALASGLILSGGAAAIDPVIGGVTAGAMGAYTTPLQRALVKGAQAMEHVKGGASPGYIGGMSGSDLNPYADDFEIEGRY